MVSPGSVKVRTARASSSSMPLPATTQSAPGYPYRSAHASRNRALTGSGYLRSADSGIERRASSTFGDGG